MKDIKQKQQYLLDAVSDAVSDLLYYDRKECEQVTVDDIEEIMTPEFAEELAKEFRCKLMKE